MPVTKEKECLLPLILASFSGRSLFGLLGIFLAIPRVAVLKFLISHAHRNLLQNNEAK